MVKKDTDDRLGAVINFVKMVFLYGIFIIGFFLFVLASSGPM